METGSILWTDLTLIKLDLVQNKNKPTFRRRHPGIELDVGTSPCPAIGVDGFGRNRLEKEDQGLLWDEESAKK